MNLVWTMTGWPAGHLAWRSPGANAPRGRSTGASHSGHLSMVRHYSPPGLLVNWTEG